VAYINSFSKRYEIIEAIEIGLDKEDGESGRDGAVYRAWANLEIDKALSSAEVTITSEKDGSILAYLSKKKGPSRCFCQVISTKYCKYEVLKSQRPNYR
jgi:hypothetical protein